MVIEQMGLEQTPILTLFVPHIHFFLKKKEQMLKMMTNTQTKLLRIHTQHS